MPAGQPRLVARRLDLRRQPLEHRPRVCRDHRPDRPRRVLPRRLAVEPDLQRVQASPATSAAVSRWADRRRATRGPADARTQTRRPAAARRNARSPPVPAGRPIADRRAAESTPSRRTRPPPLPGRGRAPSARADHDSRSRQLLPQPVEQLSRGRPRDPRPRHPRAPAFPAHGDVERRHPGRPIRHQRLPEGEVEVHRPRSPFQATSRTPGTPAGAATAPASGTPGDRRPRRTTSTADPYSLI